jgi:hypothetical protein
MRKLLVIAAVLCSGVAMAQTSPPTVGGKPLVQVKPGGAAPKHQSIAVRLQACLDIEDATKERLDCYDAIFPPKPKPKPPAVKAVTDCTFIKEEDERLKCFNGFVEKLPKPPK